MELKDILIKASDQLEIRLEDKQVQSFLLYLRELQIWNKRINLTAIKEDREIIIKHFIDSLTCFKATDFPPDAKVIDIGTGAGFPGIPLKIYQPGIKLTLLESVRKKTQFLEHICEILGYENVEIIWGRAEEYGRKENYREKFDLALSRAVANLNVLCEYCLPFLKIGGIFIAQKSKKIYKELKEAEYAMEVLGGKFKGIINLNLPFTKVQRNLILLQKIQLTPSKYPRKPGIPEKHPLKPG